MANEDLVRAERVAVGASRGWVGDPSSGSGLHEVAEHPIKPRGCLKTVRFGRVAWSWS